MLFVIESHELLASVKVSSASSETHQPRFPLLRTKKELNKKYCCRNRSEVKLLIRNMTFYREIMKINFMLSPCGEISWALARFLSRRARKVAIKREEEVKRPRLVSAPIISRETETDLNNLCFLLFCHKMCAHTTTSDGFAWFKLGWTFQLAASR